MTPLVGAKLNGQIFCNPCISWKSNNFVCRLSMSWLYVSTGIMISVNSVLEIDRAIAIISPFHRIQFQDQFLTEIYFLFFCFNLEPRLNSIKALYEFLYSRSACNTAFDLLRASFLFVWNCLRSLYARNCILFIFNILSRVLVSYP